MRFVVVPLLLLSASPALAQYTASPAVPAQPSVAAPIAPAAPAEDSATAPPAAADSRPTKEDRARHVVKMQECIRALYRKTDSIKNRIRLRITIDPEGRVRDDPEVMEPIDNDEFRNDVTALVQRLHECEPFKIGSSDLTFTQVVTFNPDKRLGKDVLPLIRVHFHGCNTKRETGPDIVIAFKYNKDGSYAERPRLVGAQDAPEYSEAATALIEQLDKCPTADFPPNRYYQWASFTMRFRSKEAGQSVANPASSTVPSDMEPPPSKPALEILAAPPAEPAKQ